MKLHTKILLGLALGAAAGVAVNQPEGVAPWVTFVNTYVAGPIGQIFLRLLFMVVIPLVFATLVLGVAGLGDLRRVGRVGAKTLAYFVVSAVAAAVIGLVLVNGLQPGAGMPREVSDRLIEAYRGAAAERVAGGARSFGINTFVQIVPRNPIQAAASMDMLGVIFFALIFGVALSLISAERAAPVLRLLEAVADAVIKIIELVMRLAPYGVAGLIFVATSQFGLQLLRQLGLYVIVVLTGLLLHSAGTLSLLLRVLARASPLQFWWRVRDVIVTAFSTSSSSATLPTSLLVAERELKLPREIAGFVLPLGATMNMNGTALFEGVTILFVAQVFGIHLSVPAQVVVVALAVLTAIGAAGVPGGSIPLLFVVAETVGVPAEGIAIILGVDRLLDMCRTTVNVTGDLTAACVVGRTEGVWDSRAWSSSAPSA